MRRRRGGGIRHAASLVSVPSATGLKPLRYTSGGPTCARGKLLCPIGEFAIGGEGLGGALGEVDGEGDAVAGVAAEENYIFVFGVGAEEGREVAGEKDGAAPAMSDADVFQCGMKGADAVFERF